MSLSRKDKDFIRRTAGHNNDSEDAGKGCGCLIAIIIFFMLFGGHC